MSEQPQSPFARRVRAAKPRDKRFGVRDDKAPLGLTLRVWPSGAHSFTLETTEREKILQGAPMRHRGVQVGVSSGPASASSCLHPRACTSA